MNKFYYIGKDILTIMSSIWQQKIKIGINKLKMMDFNIKKILRLPGLHLLTGGMKNN